MFFNPRGVALLIALTVSIITTISVSFFKENTFTSLSVTATLSFLTSFSLMLFSLEFMLLREIEKIYVLIDKLKQKDFKIHKKKIKANINPLRRLNAEIISYTNKKQQEIEELKKLETYRKEFLADVSHELKTPIFAAQGFIYTLLDGAADDKDIRDKFLNKAAKSLDGLSELVQDLLTVSQMESGDIQMKLQQCDMVSLTQEIFEELEEKAHKRNISLSFDKNSDHPAIAKADPHRMRQVMNNLIDNAIKYGNEAGKVRVNFSVEKESLLVEVKDDGIGIEHEHLKRIFERFYRIEKSRSKDKGGTGLGLAIVKHIIEAHRTKVIVTSKIGKGTTFSFKLDKI